MTERAHSITRALHQEKIALWLAQFRSDEQPIVQKMLDHYLFLDSTTLLDMLKALHTDFISSQSVDPRNVVYCPIGFVAKSGAAMAYFYRTVNEIDVDQFIDAENFVPGVIEDIETLLLRKGHVFVFIDDFIGEGNQACDFWSSYLDAFARRHPDCRFVMLAAVATEKGLAHVRRDSGFLVHTSLGLKSWHRVLSEDSLVYPDPQERARASNIIAEYGKRLIPRHPFGYGEGQLLLSFFYSTPNNTLPIFWATDGTWIPLVPRADSFRGASAHEHPRPTAVQKSRVLMRTPDDYDIDHRTTVTLSEEFGSLRLVTQFVTSGVSKRLLVGVLEMIRTLKFNAHEKKPVETLTAVGGLSQSDEMELLNFAEMVRPTTLQDSESIKSVSGLVQARHAMMLFDEDGILRSIVSYRLKGHVVREDFVPTRLWAYVALSRLNPAGVFLQFNGLGNVHIFSCGRRVLWCRNGVWHTYDSLELVDALKEIRRGTPISESPLFLLAGLAVELSDSADGSTLIIGDEKNVLTACNTPLSNVVKYRNIQLSHENLPVLCSLARHEGAMIFSAGAELLTANTILNPGTDTEWQSEPARGSRHDSAAKMTSRYSCLAIVISADDGRISFYKNGQRQFYIYP